jgi:hypothetical protein
MRLTPLLGATPRRPFFWDAGSPLGHGVGGYRVLPFRALCAVQLAHFGRVYSCDP